MSVYSYFSRRYIHPLPGPVYRIGIERREQTPDGRTFAWKTNNVGARGPGVTVHHWDARLSMYMTFQVLVIRDGMVAIDTVRLHRPGGAPFGKSRL